MVHSLITLYPSTETEFTTNGLGALGDAISCSVTEEANGSFELEMEYPVTGRRYSDIQNRAIIYAKPNPVDPPQPFRIYEISRPMNGRITCYASHISYDLSGYPVMPFSAQGAQNAFAGLKQNSVYEHPFTFWTDKDLSSKFKIKAPLSTRSALGGVEGSILDTYHGEYKFDGFQIKLYTHRGIDRGVSIRYGKNLTDLNQEENCSKVYTGVLPYWRDENQGILVKLPENVLPTKGTYNFINVYTLDLSSDFVEQPTVEQLRARAQKYIDDNDLGVPKVSLDVSFIQLEQTEEYKHLTLLERVELFDTVNVEFPEMNVSADAKVCKTVYDALAGRYSSVTLGSIRSSISDSILEQDQSIAQIGNQTKTDTQRAIENATKWITNGRGYMVAIKNEAGDWMEICSLDTPNIDTAVNVWRWNNGGFGHSSHGYNGPYETAITQDGHIVADFITTGTLSASLVKAGVLQSDDGKTFYLDLDNGVLKMNASEFTVGGQTVNEISSSVATPIAQNAANAAVNAQTQQSIFNKLTNNGQTQGIYLKDGLLYINGSYIQAGTINADYIRAGVIADNAGRNSWDLNTGKMIARDITAYGSFRTGSEGANTYTILGTDAMLRGYYLGVENGYVDVSSNSIDSEGKLYRGVRISARDQFRIDTQSLSVCQWSEYHKDEGWGPPIFLGGISTTVSPKLVYEKDGKYYTGQLNIQTVHGIVINMWWTDW